MTHATQRKLPSPSTAATRTGAVRKLRRSFTVVELLVVIAVIGILMSLITVAAYNALWSARQTRIKVELDGIATAVKAFKEKYGSYPPINFYDPRNNNDLKSFVAKAFPRYNQRAQKTIGSLTGEALVVDLQALGVDITTRKNGDPAMALVFWLSGFSPDVTSPFTGGGARTRLFDFDPTRVMDTTTGKTANMDDSSLSTFQPGHWVYMPPSIDAPFLYFDSRSYLSRDPVVSNPPPNSYTYNGKGYAAPYWDDKNNNGFQDTGENFVNLDSFQLIAAGQDGEYGGTAAGADKMIHMYPTGVNLDAASPPNKFPYAPAEKDNVTNFCQKNNLEDAKP